MSDANYEASVEHQRSNWVRLRTLVVIRWIAIAGQLAAILIAQRMFDLDLEVGLCMVAIGVSVVANLIAVFVYPENRRLSEREATAMLSFDIAQLTAMLFLTGGLNNPFALLILAPVAVAATTLRTSSTAVVGALAIASVTLVMWFHLPLKTISGSVMEIPQVFIFGYWVAIVVGIGFLGAYARRITVEINSMADALLAAQMALDREQKITDLAGVVAATAHELGTPLATIKLTSVELADELEGQGELAEDARLIAEQADRCRDILRSMGRAGKDDMLMRRAPLSAVIEEAAEPHMQRGKEIVVSCNPGPDASREQPVVWRRPEIIHGLRNLIQNAVDFATSTVWIDLHWTSSKVFVRIIDDGRGFPLQVIGRLGDPFIRLRKTESSSRERPGYEGMGLGLFIAKTLLERSGAEITFENCRDAYGEPRTPGKKCGAIVELVWPVDKIVAQGGDTMRLGENPQIPV